VCARTLEACGRWGCADARGVRTRSGDGTPTVSVAVGGVASWRVADDRCGRFRYRAGGVLATRERP